MRSLFAPADAAKALKPEVSESFDQETEKFWNMHVERAEKLKNLINIPAENEYTLIWTENSFNAFTFIPFCFSHFGIIHELYISTYSINRRIADALIREVDAGHIQHVSIFISESLISRMPQVIDHLNAQLASRPQIKLIFAWNHSKITCVRCGTTYLVLEGSGNYSENARFEQYVLFNSQKSYEFRKENITTCRTVV